MKDGVLQYFIHPKGIHNETIRCIWGPKLCLFERCINRHKLYDQSIDMYKRVLTCEVEKMQQTIEPVIGKVLPQRLEISTNNIVEHIQSISSDRFQIQRLVVNYRIDDQDQIWFLGCESIRVLDKQVKSQPQKKRKGVYNNNQQIELPSDIDQRKLFTSQKIRGEVMKNQACIRCDKKYIREELMIIKIRDVIESWDFDHIGQANQKNLIEPKIKSNFANLYQQEFNAKKIFALLALKSINKIANPVSTSPAKETGKMRLIMPPKKNILLTKYLQKSQKKEQKQTAGRPIDIERNYRVPVLIRKIFPHLNEKKQGQKQIFNRYLEMLDNPGFLECEIQICEDCYTLIDKRVNIHGDVGKMAAQEKLVHIPFLGTEKLDPECILKRFDVMEDDILQQLTRKDILNKQRSELSGSETLRVQRRSFQTTAKMHRGSYSLMINNDIVLKPLLSQYIQSKYKSNEHSQITRIEIKNLKDFEAEKQRNEESLPTSRFNFTSKTSSRSNSFAELFTIYSNKKKI